MKSAVGIIYAGGTFGSHGKPLASLPAPIFLPVLKGILHTHFASYTRDTARKVAWQLLDNEVIKDSRQLTPVDFAHFYQLINKGLQQGIRQFVLLTGTDTLSYLAAFLAECFASSQVCIIVTGAMKPLLDSQVLHDYVLDANSDATQNLFDACKLAWQGEAGVRVCFAGEHWAAQTVQKIHSHDLMAFVGHHRAGYPANSYTSKITAVQHEGWLADKVAHMTTTAARISHANIAVLYLTPMTVQQLAQRLQDILTTEPHALIIMAFGAGNMADDTLIREQLYQAKQQGCLVAVSSQCAYGGVSQTYEAGAWLANCGVLTTARLSLPAIFARLLWLTANYDTPARRRQRWLHCLKDAHTVA